jgi:uncharacterized protein YqeY
VSLRSRINDDLKAAIRAAAPKRRDALRLLLAAIQQREVDERRALGDAEVIGVIERLARQRREAIEQFEKGGRADLAEKERFELELLQSYLPQALSDAEIESAVNEAIGATRASAPGDIGKVMAALKSRLVGRADLSKVAALVKARLSGG